MKFTLKTLMEEVGCKKYPERWGEIFDGAMAEYDEQGCYLTKVEFYDELHEKYGCFSKYGEVYKAAARQTAEDEALSRFLTLLAMALQDDEHKKDDLKMFSRPVTPEGKGVLAYEMVTGLALCSQLETGAENMRKRGFPQETINDVLTLAVGGVSTSERKNNGAPGFELLGWAQLYINARLLIIERLEIEFLSKFSAKAIVFQNKDGAIVSLANDLELHRDGFALGSLHYEEEEGSWIATVEETEDAWVGYPFAENGYVSGEKIELSKEEWDKVLETGDPVIRLHIPPVGKMTPEMIDKTLVEAKKFAKEHYPDFNYKAFACHSWLVDPQLDEILNQESNIVKFRQRFHSLTRKSGGTDVFNFIFNKPNMNFDIRDLPEDSSLQRALKNHYLSGKAIYELEGFFLKS